jgi:hypothetical protein
MKFCNDCNNKLEYFMFGDALQWKCNACDKITPLQDEDTLIMEKIFDSNVKQIQPRTMLNALHDPTSLRIEKKCPLCGAEISVCVRSPNDEKLHEICPCQFAS